MKTIKAVTVEDIDKILKAFKDNVKVNMDLMSLFVDLLKLSAVEVEEDSLDLPFTDPEDVANVPVNSYLCAKWLTGLKENWEKTHDNQ